jgi:hypothetical protein
MRYATKDARAMMIERRAVIMPAHPEKSNVKFPKSDELSAYVGIVVGQVRVFRSVKAESRPDPCHTFM